MRNAADVPELQHDLAALGVDGVRHLLPGGDLLVVEDAGRPGVAAPFLGDVGRFRDDEAGAGALAIVFDMHVLGHAVARRPAAGQRRHHGPVREVERSEVETAGRTSCRPWVCPDSGFAARRVSRYQRPIWGAGSRCSIPLFANAAFTERRTLNYRHAFHAGNFADVVKHALLCRLIEYLKRKDKPFRVMDTHAGRGRYDLDADEAQRTGEAEAGIEAVRRSEAWDDALLAPYREAVEAAGAELGPQSYPGSPWIARHLLRRQDRLSAYELHPVDAKALAETFAGDVQVKTIELDGWLALGAHLPPKEKRGLVLIDPPFEEVGEFERIVARVGDAWRRWPADLCDLVSDQATGTVRGLPRGAARERNAQHRGRRLLPRAFQRGRTACRHGICRRQSALHLRGGGLRHPRSLVPVLGVADRGNCGIIALVAECSGCNITASDDASPAGAFLAIARIRRMRSCLAAVSALVAASIAGPAAAADYVETAPAVIVTTAKVPACDDARVMAQVEDQFEYGAPTRSRPRLRWSSSAAFSKRPTSRWAATRRSSAATAREPR